MIDCTATRNSIIGSENEQCALLCVETSEYGNNALTRLCFFAPLSPSAAFRLTLHPTATPTHARSPFCPSLSQSHAGFVHRALRLFATHAPARLAPLWATTCLFWSAANPQVPNEWGGGESGMRGRQGEGEGEGEGEVRPDE
jgi:hypothetical protein